MARPEREPQTELAKRLREIRRIFGNEERGIFAQRLNLQRGTLANYEIGAHEPPSSVINAYYTAYNINPHWIVTGEGEMFSDMAKAKAAGFKPQTIPAGLMKKLGRIAYTTYRDENIKLPPEDIAELAAELYKKLQELVQDINDMEEVELTLPLLKLHLKRQIEAEKEHSKTTQDTA
ncbi:helix-turn-helix transcriptional regulator [Bartonella krasnovii]|uniref:Helix-turn-helix transcriptional regulator n=1 Tax=Bartonella krasnovii TaxID=2267275 RepID=A0A5B9D0X0_9HYPH|nr:helix-turn-helix transcriptional regulator [Bartonella krasnovii]QEE12088.1 helix-turn-helix transcriptional regulator [Bartonella krasnovii]UNF42899.1 helix-turn-helix transcriptional regulator [Bartonella krasnovii]UNF54407.1 helix-turn-helix transcriptional regulator [Bartonella krasnovii]UNF56108.1 helix-turn-helix transcriptional regulator [Bartonella krasnovii]